MEEMPTASVSMTELRTHTERIVWRAARGEVIAITRWGKTVGYIGPPRRDTAHSAIEIPQRSDFESGMLAALDQELARSD